MPEAKVRMGLDRRALRRSLRPGASPARLPVPAQLTHTIDCFEHRPAVQQDAALFRPAGACHPAVRAGKGAVSYRSTASILSPLSHTRWGILPAKFIPPISLLVVVPVRYIVTGPSGRRPAADVSRMVPVWAAATADRIMTVP